MQPDLNGDPSTSHMRRETRDKTFLCFHKTQEMKANAEIISYKQCALLSCINIEKSALGRKHHSPV